MKQQEEKQSQLDEKREKERVFERQHNKFLYPERYIYETAILAALEKVFDPKADKPSGANEKPLNGDSPPVPLCIVGRDAS